MRVLRVLPIAARMIAIAVAGIVLTAIITVIAINFRSVPELRAAMAKYGK